MRVLVDRLYLKYSNWPLVNPEPANLVRGFEYAAFGLVNREWAREGGSPKLINSTNRSIDFFSIFNFNLD